MDNASNCTKLAELLPNYLPDFWGMDARLRCLAHIVNLIAKVKTSIYQRIPSLKTSVQIFISFFFKRPKVKKSVVIPSQNDDDGEVSEEEHIIDAGDTSEDDESPAAEEAVIDAEENVEDDGQVAHDDAVVRSVHDHAIEKMASTGVTMTAEEEREALKLFPAVCLQINSD